MKIHLVFGFAGDSWKIVLPGVVFEDLQYVVYYIVRVYESTSTCIFIIYIHITNYYNKLINEEAQKTNEESTDTNKN
jgi:hypothetical protein